MVGRDSRRPLHSGFSAAQLQRAATIRNLRGKIAPATASVVNFANLTRFPPVSPIPLSGRVCSRRYSRSLRRHDSLLRSVEKNSLADSVFPCTLTDVRNGKMNPLALDYDSQQIGRSCVVHADCLEWLSRIPENSLHAVVTDPPYGVKEYDLDQLEKRSAGSGGLWRIPPSYDGHTRAPLPRFTALDASERARMRQFFVDWAKLAVRALRPGAHVFMATNAYIAQLLYDALVDGGLEFRGQVVRLVRTLRGGDRPKNAEREFPDVSSMPKGCYEQWGLFRKPLGGITVGQCLRKWQTGGLRRISDERPFEDLIPSERTPRRERQIADHPSLKPQSFLRRLAYAALPTGQGVIADPFMGSGSTIAACEAVGVSGIGVERFRDYFDLAKRAIPRLAAVEVSRVDRTVRATRRQPTLF
jgi:site-specific DNA-methyltransferase (adenine-specific)